MDSEHVRTRVESQISYWRSVGRLDWAEALELCLAKADRCQAMQDAVLARLVPAAPPFPSEGSSEELPTVPPSSL
jgi:hypothetical protein